MPSLSDRFSRSHIVFLHDIFMAGASFLLALYLRLGDVMVAKTSEWLIEGTVLFTVVCAVAFWSMRLYRGVWRYASLNDLLAITRSVTLAILVFTVLMFMWTRLEELPRSLPFINWFVLMALLGGPRFLYRLFKDRRFDMRLEREGHQRVPVLLVGAGDTAELFIRSLSRPRDANYLAVGIISASRGRVGRNIHGVEVLGTIDDIPAAVDRLARRGVRPQRLVLTDDDMDGERVRALLDTALEAGMTLARLPRLTDFKSGIGDGVEVRPIAVEDLLGRPQTALDRGAMRALVEGRRVLVTGAGGSIGGELVRQVSDFAPARLDLLDNSEFNLYSIELELARRQPGIEHSAVLGDIKDRGRIERLFADLGPELVFHAAALKHVPLVEANPVEGVATNVLGTVNVADACIAAGTRTMVMISTDKAVNPIGVMGATKRAAEICCQVRDLGRGQGDTRFVTVRFGNVLGSTGSVVPLFRRQLAEGGPLTITHPDMTRYFMTVREAVELVLQASALGSRDDGREAGGIYVLDMGEPVRILDLARQMIRLAGLRPEIDIKVETIGARPGEKLAEETFHGGESLVPTECRGILLAAPRAADEDELGRAIDELARACADFDAEAVLAILRRLVPEYDGGEAAMGAHIA